MYTLVFPSIVFFTLTMATFFDVFRILFRIALVIFRWSFGAKGLRDGGIVHLVWSKMLLVSLAQNIYVKYILLKNWRNNKTKLYFFFDVQHELQNKIWFVHFSWQPCPRHKAWKLRPVRTSPKLGGLHGFCTESSHSPGWNEGSLAQTRNTISRNISYIIFIIKYKSLNMDQRWQSKTQVMTEAHKINEQPGNKNVLAQNTFSFLKIPKRYCIYGRWCITELAGCSVRVKTDRARHRIKSSTHLVVNLG